MSLLTPELLRQLEQFQLFAGPHVELVATPALTPALSPPPTAVLLRRTSRSGRILRRELNVRESHVLRPPFPANHQPAATGISTFKSRERTRFSPPLLGGEGRGESTHHTNLSLKFVRGMIVRGIKPQPKEFCFPIPLTNIPLTMAFPWIVRLHSRRAWTIVPDASGRRHRGWRMGRVVCHDAARTLACQWRIVGAFSGDRRVA